MIKLKQYRFKSRISLNIYLCLILIAISLLIFIPPEIAAEHREFESEKFNERITLAINDHKALDFEFQNGKELEIIYTIQVKQNLPIDIWFVNKDNYLLLTNGAQFLYYIDGTERETSYAKKIVTLTENDNYKLVMTNYYNNQTVDVDVTGEIRDYQIKSKDTSLEYSSILLYSLIIIIIIFTIILVYISLKIRKYKQINANEVDINPSKKSKTWRPKKDKIKNKSKISGKKNINKKIKETKTKISTKKNKKIKTSSNFNSYCGFCGEPVDTPFCKHCGHEV